MFWRFKKRLYLCTRNRETKSISRKQGLQQIDLVAQLVEQMTLNHWVEGSSPSRVTKSLL